jgi:hypothetical protein
MCGVVWLVVGWLFVFGEFIDEGVALVVYLLLFILIGIDVI